MKNFALALALTCSLPALANGPQFSNLSKSDVENVTREFGANFTHTVVAAPETDGLWGVEVGLVAGQTASPDFKGVIEDSGGSGSDFKNLYHAGAIARVHLPLDFFAEVNLLPEQEINDVSIGNQSYGIGWNLGGFIGLPLDVAVGAGRANTKISFKQTTPINADIKLETTTTNYWVGVSKTILFFTPYAKFGTSTIDGDLSATGQILGYTASTKEEVSVNGNYLAIGANFQLLFLKLGVEHTQTHGTQRLSGKLSLDF
jgi:hypothetical protein